MQREIPDNKYHYKLDIDKTDDHYNYGKNDLYALVIIMRHLLLEDHFRDFINELGYEIDVLDSKVDTVPLISILNKMGFPENWREISNIK